MNDMVGAKMKIRRRHLQKRRAVVVEGKVRKSLVCKTKLLQKLVHRRVKGRDVTSQLPGTNPSKESGVTFI